MADKYLKNNGGSYKEVGFLTTSAGAADAGKGIGLNAQGRLDETMMPVGIGADTKALVASEALSAGNQVSIWNDSGTAKVRKADGTTEGKFVDGFVLAATEADATATVYFEGTNNQVTGQTAGDVFLATVAGNGTSTAPSASGNVVQRIGVAVSATEVNFERGIPVILA